jgi:hypothetical protein
MIPLANVDCLCAECSQIMKSIINRHVVDFLVPAQHPSLRKSAEAMLPVAECIFFAASYLNWFEREFSSDIASGK